MTETSHSFKWIYSHYILIREKVKPSFSNTFITRNKVSQKCNNNSNESRTLEAGAFPLFPNSAIPPFLPPFLSWRTEIRPGRVMSLYLKPQKRVQCTQPRGDSKQIRSESAHLTFSSHHVSTSWAFLTLSTLSAAQRFSVHEQCTAYQATLQHIIKPLHNVVHSSNEPSYSTGTFVWLIQKCCLPWPLSGRDHM